MNSTTLAGICCSSMMLAVWRQQVF